MIHLDGQPFGNCAGITRRGLLQAGVLGLSGLTLADLMKARAMASTRSRVAVDNTSVILIWLDGGPPQHETYDPKPEAPAEFRGPLKAMETRVPGIQISELLPEHARVMDKMALIRSMHHDNGDHFAAAHWMLTGYLGSNSVNLAPQYPSAGSVITRLKGAKTHGMPAYVGLPNTHSVGIAPGYHGGAYLGSAFGPFNADGDPNDPNYKVNNLSLSSGVTVDRLHDRKLLLASFDSTRRALDEAKSTAGDPFQNAAFDLLTGPAARAAFDLNAESPRLKDRYGRHQWGQSALVARRLVEAGTRFVTLTFGGWDYHSSLDKGMHNVLPILDRCVATLVDDLDQRGMLDTTLVLVMGEFGRTPKINQGLPNDPIPGRDHWGQVMSVLAAGAGIAGGRVVGSSNARGEVPKDLPLTPADLVTTIYDRLGLDPETTFYDRVNRPIPIVPHGGRVIQELF